MWSFAAAPGSLPLPKETPLSGYLPGNPVPAERRWMEPRWNVVPHRDGLEPCVPWAEHQAQGSGDAQGGLPGATQRRFQPRSLHCAKSAPKTSALLHNMFLIHWLQRAHCRGTHGPPPLKKRSRISTTTTTSTQVFMDLHHKNRGLHGPPPHAQRYS